MNVRKYEIKGGCHNNSVIMEIKNELKIESFFKMLQQCCSLKSEQRQKQKQKQMRYQDAQNPGARKKKLRGQHSQRIAADNSPIVLRRKSVINDQVPSMTGKHVSNLLACLGTIFSLMKIYDNRRVEKVKRKLYVVKSCKAATQCGCQ